MSQKLVYAHPPGEGWIVDRFVNEWRADNTDINTTDARTADIIWIYADWCWKELASRGLLDNKKVITTVHHIVPEKFGSAELDDFRARDSFTTAYHVPNKYTHESIQNLTNKPIYMIPYWANDSIWHKTGKKEDFRNKYNVPNDSFIIGSFQRDTEGYDLKSPKLEKGPDLFLDFVDRASLFGYNELPIHVLLSGWRRQYVIEGLKCLGVSYTYIELPTQTTINELYQCLDIYPVTSRYEGGPQSLIECGLLGIRTVSRNIGIADQVLSQTAISNNVFDAIPEIPNVDHLKLPLGYKQYRQLFERI